MKDLQITEILKGFWIFPTTPENNCSAIFGLNHKLMKWKAFNPESQQVFYAATIEEIRVLIEFNEPLFLEHAENTKS